MAKANGSAAAAATTSAAPAWASAGSVAPTANAVALPAGTPVNQQGVQVNPWAPASASQLAYLLSLAVRAGYPLHGFTAASLASLPAGAVTSLLNAQQSALKLQMAAQGIPNPGSPTITCGNGPCAPHLAAAVAQVALILGNASVPANSGTAHVWLIGASKANQLTWEQWLQVAQAAHGTASA